MTQVEIKSYKKLRGNLYEVSLDNGDDYKLFDDIILKYELLLDKNIDEKKLAKVLDANSEMEAYYKALKYIGVRMRSELEIRKYLKKYEIPYKAINKAVAKLKEDRYINPARYAEAYVNDAVNLTLNGPRKVKDNLLKLGIDEAYIDDNLTRFGSSIWQDRIVKILDKKSKMNKAGLALFKNKSYADLMNLGYYSEDIKAVLESYTLDTKEVFEREAAKVYDKLSCKYEGVELELRFKSKMYAKGFEADRISSYLDEHRQD